MNSAIMDQKYTSSSKNMQTPKERKYTTVLITARNKNIQSWETAKYAEVMRVLVMLLVLDNQLSIFSHMHACKLREHFPFSEFAAANK